MTRSGVRLVERKNCWIPALQSPCAHRRTSLRVAVSSGSAARHFPQVRGKRRVKIALSVDVQYEDVSV
jgi:hypothetical protein